MFRVFMILLMLVVAVPCWGQYQYPVVYEYEGDARAFETLSSITASTGFTAGTMCVTESSGGKRCAKAALISVETAAIRFTLDGTTPTVTAGTGAGHLVESGGSYLIKGFSNVTNFRCINAVGSSGATVKVTYFF